MITTYTSGKMTIQAMSYDEMYYKADKTIYQIYLGCILAFEAVKHGSFDDSYMQELIANPNAAIDCWLA